MITFQTYKRSSPPALDGGDVRYLAQELTKIQEALQAIQNLTPQQCSIAPPKPLPTMIRFAMAPWRPVAGQTTDKWVTYVNGAWAYLASS